MTFLTERWVREDGSEHMVQVFTCKGHSLTFRDADRERAFRKAEIFMEGEMERLGKSEAAKHARAAGRKRQVLTRTSGVV